METGELLGRLRLAADTLAGYPDAAAEMNRRCTPLTRAAREAVNRRSAEPPAPCLLGRGVPGGGAHGPVQRNADQPRKDRR